MPAFYAHKFFGETVLAALPSPLYDAIISHHNAFILGTESPDLLFYYKPLSKNDVKTKGMDLHLRKAKTFFEACAKKIDKTAQNTQTPPAKTAVGAYVAGCICHYMLDTACHPNVYKLEDTGVSHGLIESEFDKYLKRQMGEKVHKNAAKHLKTRKDDVCAIAYVLEVEKKQIKRAISTMKKINGMFSCPYKLFHALAKVVLDKLNATKFENMFLHFANDPACDELNPILHENLKNAVAPAAETVCAYFNSIENNAVNSEVYIQFDKNYEGERLL